MDESIGERLRYVRGLYGVSQRQLAKRTGIANSTISLIESNRTNPSVAALERLLDGIPISIGEFFAIDPRPRHVFSGPHNCLEISNSAMFANDLLKHPIGRGLHLTKHRYEPGTDTGQVMLCHESEGVGIVVSGSVEMTVGDECRCLSAGEAYYLDSNRPHRFRCIGSEPCEIVSANTPAPTER